MVRRNQKMTTEIIRCISALYNKHIIHICKIHRELVHGTKTILYFPNPNTKKIINPFRPPFSTYPDGLLYPQPSLSISIDFLKLSLYSLRE